MKIKCTKITKETRDFNFEETAYTKISSNVLNMLIDNVESKKTETEDSTTEMLFFKDKEDYKENAEYCNVDLSRPVFVNNQNGSFFCYSKSRANEVKTHVTEKPAEENKKDISDAANSKTNNKVAS